MNTGDGKLLQFYFELKNVVDMDPVTGLEKLICCILSLWDFSTNWLKPEKIDFGSKIERRAILEKFIRLGKENKDIAQMCARVLTNVTKLDPISVVERQYSKKWI